MGALKSRKVELLSEIEASEGVMETPAAATDSMRLLAPGATLSWNVDTATSGAVSGSLDDDETVIGGMSAGLVVPFDLHGADTAGAAPDWGRHAEAAGWLKALDTVIPSSGTNDATGGTTSSFTIDTAVSTQWPTTDGALVGRVVELSTNPATPIQVQIKGYVMAGAIATVTIAETLGSALSSATDAKVLPSALYRPHSGTIPSLTNWGYADGLLFKLEACRGGLAMQWTVRQRGTITFNEQGRFNSNPDTAIVTPTLVAAVAPTWRKATGGGAFVGGVRTQLAGLSLTDGNGVAAPDDPNENEGFGVFDITRRKLTGSLERYAALGDGVFAAFRAGTETYVAVRAGTVAGNRIFVLLPRVRATSHAMNDRNGFLVYQQNFEANGRDSGAYICVA